MPNMCRTCMSKDVETIPIFDQSKSPSISAMITTISSLEFLPNDTLPTEICVLCVETLELTYYFQEQVIRCNNTLQKQSQRSKLLKRCKMMAQEQEEEEEDEEEEEMIPETDCKQNESLPIVDSDDELTTDIDISILRDHSSHYHDPLITIGDTYNDVDDIDDTYDTLPECDEKSLSIESLLPNEAHDALPEHSSYISDVNSHQEDTCFKSEDVEVEGNGVQLEDNSEITPEEVLSENNADDNGFSSEDDVPLTELHVSIDNASKSQDAQQTSNEKGEETSQASKGLKRLREELNSSSVKRIDLYKCEVCRKSFQYPSNLATHMRVHTGERPFKCQHCRADFKYIGDLNTHIHKHASGKKCDICGEIIVGPVKFKEHMQTHMRAHSDDKPFKCQYCDETFKYNVALNKHMLKHADVAKSEYKCEICQETFAGPHKLKEHRRTHPGADVIKCHQCDATFKDLGQLRIHSRHHIAPGDVNPKSFQCDVCGKIFPSRVHLERHIMTHTGEKPFDCQHCDMKFTQPGNLRQHIRNKHTGDTTSKRQKCENCEKRFATPGDMEIHMRTHENDNSFKCQICDATYRHIGHLNRHVSLHTTGVTAKCEVCGKFIKSIHLAAHIREHTGERPFECQHCDAKFAQVVILNAHVRRKHTAPYTIVKPHQCESCGKAFEASSQLKMHMKSHTGEMPFKCHQCSAAFMRVSHLKKHIRLHALGRADNSHTCSVCSMTFESECLLLTHMSNHSGERLNVSETIKEKS